jgi:hypothetical protein
MGQAPLCGILERYDDPLAERRQCSLDTLRLGEQRFR